MSSDVMIVEVVLPAPQCILLQSLLQGEDGLATIRCFDPEKKRQQFWTTETQLGDLYEWIESLPESLAVNVTGEWWWKPDKQSDVQGESE